MMTIWMGLAATARFETERLILRPFRYEDGDDFYQMVSKPENMPFIFPALPDKNLAVATMVEKFMRQPLGNWALVDKVSQQLIGALCFEKMDESKVTAELSYFLKKEKWRQGLMTEAVRNLVFLAFYELGLRELTIITHLENAASQAVARKAGFVQVDHYRGSDRYSHKTRDYLKFSLKKADFRLEINEENQ